jgi:hypothetical protein
LTGTHRDSPNGRARVEVPGRSRRDREPAACAAGAAGSDLTGDLLELGYERRPVDAIFRGCGRRFATGYSRRSFAVRDYLAFIEANTYYRRSRVR